MRSNFPNNIIQKVLILVPLTETRPEVFVATMTTFLSDYYDALEENLTYMKILNIKSYLGDNIKYVFAEIFVDSERLESVGTFKPENLGYITCVFEGAYDSRFHLWDIQKYKEVTDFIKKLCVCDMYIIS